MEMEGSAGRGRQKPGQCGCESEKYTGHVGVKWHRETYNLYKEYVSDGTDCV